MYRNALVATLLLLLALPALAQEPKQAVRAQLGLSSRAPTADEVTAFKLERNVRNKGQIVDKLVEGGAADKAGIKPGDAIIRLDNNDLYSFDDVRDFVATSQPNKKVTASPANRTQQAIPCGLLLTNAGAGVTMRQRSWSAALIRAR